MKHCRVLVGCLLLSLLIGLMIYYSLEHNNHDPDIHYILDHFEQFKTTKIRIVGEVKNVDRIKNTLLIKVSQPPKSIIFISTTELLNTTQQGDVVEVYGVLNNRTHMTAEKLMIGEKWKNDLIFVRSVFAIPYVLYLFLKTWHFNPNTCHFERRQRHA